jgi:hypothetical protein
MRLLILVVFWMVTLCLSLLFLMTGCTSYSEMTPEQRAYLAASVGQSLQNYGNQMQDTARAQGMLAQQALIQQQYQPAYHPVFTQPYQSNYQWTPIPVTYIPPVR